MMQICNQEAIDIYNSSSEQYELFDTQFFEETILTRRYYVIFYDDFMRLWRFIIDLPKNSIDEIEDVFIEDPIDCEGVKVVRRYVPLERSDK